MKHLKTFEDTKKNYKIGDYVIIDRDAINADLKKFKYCRAIVSDDDTAKIFNIDDDKYSHGIRFNNDEEFYIKKSEIKRLATKDEIYEYEIPKDLKKYNL